MHAIRQHELGGPEVLRWEAVPLVAPGPGAVRVAVDVAGVHLLDTALRAGDTGGSPIPLPELPATPGREVAGRVEATGDGVDPAWLGRRVVAHLGTASGGYAARVVTDAARLHALPDGLPLTHAVAMVGTGRTALLVLRAAEIRARDVVLVPSAAGGLGILLVQAALRAGADVIALAGGLRKAEIVRSHAGAWASGPTGRARAAAGRVDGSGAERASAAGRLGRPSVLRAGDAGRLDVVDYRADGWPAAVRDVLEDREPTLLLDGVGGIVAHELTPLVRWGGRVLTFGWSGAATVPAGVGPAAPARLGPGAPGDGFYAARGITRTSLPGPRDDDDLRALETEALAAAAARELVPLVDDRFALADAAAAHAALEARETTGKVILRA